MKRNNWIAPILVVVGTVLIFFSTWSPQNKFQLDYFQRFSKKNLARLIEKTGSVKIQNSEMSVAADVKMNALLESRDILSTDVDSEALIEFINQPDSAANSMSDNPPSKTSGGPSGNGFGSGSNSGGQFRVTEKSEILIDKLDSGAPLVVIRSGEIFIERFGSSPSFWVRSEGQIYSAADYALIDKRNSSRLREPIPDLQGSKQSQAQLSQLEIETVLNSKKNDFFKCFGQLIQKDPQASGQVLIAFTIEKQGSATKVEISKSELTDIKFKSCLVEVVARTRFRSFSGSPVATVFPLKFE